MLEARSSEAVKDKNLVFRRCLIRRKKWCFMYSFSIFCGIHHQTIIIIIIWLGMQICIKYSFSESKKCGFEYKKWKQLLGIFIFSKNKHNVIFVINSKFVTPNLAVFHQWLSLSLSLFGPKIKIHDNNFSLSTGQECSLYFR